MSIPICPSCGKEISRTIKHRRTDLCPDCYELKRAEDVANNKQTARDKENDLKDGIGFMEYYRQKWNKKHPNNQLPKKY